MRTRPIERRAENRRKTPQEARKEASRPHLRLVSSRGEACPRDPEGGGSQPPSEAEAAQRARFDEARSFVRTCVDPRTIYLA